MKWSAEPMNEDANELKSGNSAGQMTVIFNRTKCIDSPYQCKDLQKSKNSDKLLAPVGGKMILLEKRELEAESSPDADLLYRVDLSPDRCYEIYDKSAPHFSGNTLGMIGPRIEYDWKKSGEIIGRNLYALTQKTFEISFRMDDIDRRFSEGSVLVPEYGMNSSSRKMILLDSNEIYHDRYDPYLWHAKLNTGNEYRSYVIYKGALGKDYLPKISVSGADLYLREQRQTDDHFIVRFKADEMPANPYSSQKSLIPIGDGLIAIEAEDTDGIKNDRRNREMKYAILDRTNTYNIFTAGQNGQMEMNDGAEGKDLEAYDRHRKEKIREKERDKMWDFREAER